MVRAILEGRKTQTRRIIKPQYEVSGSIWTSIKTKTWMHQSKIENCESLLKVCPYGQVGDILWVRETWQVVFELEYDHHAMDGSCVNIREWIPNFDSVEKTCVGLSSEWSCASMPERNKYYVYMTSDIQFIDGKHKLKWKPSIFMPKAASRIKLEITDIRVERLQDISEEDAIAEGIQTLCDPKISKTGSGEKFYNENDYPTDYYQRLWESINGKGSWDLNPWVWVISFKRVNTLENSEFPLKEQQLFMDILNDERDENNVPKRIC